MSIRKIAMFAAACLMTAAVSGAVVSEKTVEVKNANFAEFKDGMPVGWYKSGTIAITPGKEGDSNFVTLKADKEAGWPHLLQDILRVQDLPALKDGESYEFLLSYRQKPENVEKHAFGGIGIFGKGKRLTYKDGQNLPGTKEWQERTVTLKVDAIPADSEFIRISLYLNGTGTVSYANVKFIIRVVDGK